MDIESKKAPRRACYFRQDGGVEFAGGDAKEGKNHFRITAYSGGIIENHFLWGNLAFDLEGIKFAKNRTPILAEHDRMVHIGFTTKQRINGNVTLEGEFLSNDVAQQVRADMIEGFPFQASVYLPPAKVEHIKKGESVVVNGHTLQGPGTIFRKGEIQEVSICTLGYDSHTQSQAFTDDEEEIDFEVAEEASDQKKYAAKIAQWKKEFSESPYLQENYVSLQDYIGEKLEEACEFDELADELIQMFAERGEKSNSNAVTSETVSQQTEQLTSSASTKTKPMSPEEKYTEEFNADEKIKVEFGGPEGLKDYLAFRKYESQGRVSVSNGGVVRGGDIQASLKAESEDGGKTAKLENESKLREYELEFRQSAELQVEFGQDLGAYISFRKAEDKGLVNIVGGRVTSVTK